MSALTQVKAVAGRVRETCAMHDSLAFAGRNVPRYTSYPTAPHFTADVTADTYAGWLAALAPAQRLSLYLHVPYCTNLCLYCGCHTKVMRRQDPLEQYAKLLMREIALAGRAAGSRSVQYIHWGGGTPSILGPDRLRHVTDALAAHFDLAQIDEHAIELDPRHLPPALVRGLAAIGINRVSLGVQEFTPRVQEAIGRVQPYALVRKGVEALREAGLTRINFDLMYGLPLQTTDDIKRTVELACGLAPDRVALFGYAHVPWFKARQRLIDAAALPGLTARIAQAEVAAQALAAHGYVAIGLDHFARPDDSLAIAARERRLHRNFQGYTTDAADALIGFGVSAIGRLPQGYAQNVADVGNYARAIESGRLATARGFAFAGEDRLRAHVIEALMCNLAVDLDAAIDAVPTPGANPNFAAELAELAPLAARGLVTIDGHRITVTEAGRPFVRLVAAAFDAYLTAAPARHSVAV
ncbi:MAG TPA: oxygen-independent coproporphyrinogen III oxidase [Xanthobacteraceae bacterium]|nr:oxygen-independent coproporphyrinogen III oxidase [Xanthobacteraceae bacterium]